MFINPVGVSALMTPYLMADTAAISGRVISVMADTLGVDASTITEDTTFQSFIDVKGSSIVSELAQAIEIEFDAKLNSDPIPTNVLRGWKTVGDGIRWLAALG